MRRKFKADREAQHREVVAKARRKHQAVKGREGGAQRALEARKVRGLGVPWLLHLCGLCTCRAAGSGVFSRGVGAVLALAQCPTVAALWRHAREVLLFASP